MKTEKGIVSGRCGDCGCGSVGRFAGATDGAASCDGPTLALPISAALSVARAVPKRASG